MTSRRARERNPKRQMKAAPEVVADIYIGVACPEPDVCRTGRRFCGGDCEQYDIDHEWETPNVR